MRFTSLNKQNRNSNEANLNWVMELHCSGNPRLISSLIPLCPKAFCVALSLSWYTLLESYQEACKIQESSNSKQFGRELGESMEWYEQLSTTLNIFLIEIHSFTMTSTNITRIGRCFEIHLSQSSALDCTDPMRTEIQSIWRIPMKNKIKWKLLSPNLQGGLLR